MIDLLIYSERGRSNYHPYKTMKDWNIQYSISVIAYSSPILFMWSYLFNPLLKKMTRFYNYLFLVVCGCPIFIVIKVGLV